MKKALRVFIILIKKSLAYPFLWVGVIYLLWFIKLPVPIDENFEGGVRFLGIYILIAVLEKLLGGNRTLSIVLFILVLPIALIAVFLLLYLMGGTFGWLRREIIYIPLILLFLGYEAYNLYQRPAKDNKTLRILLFITILPILLLNVAQSVSYFPDVTDQKDWENNRYYLVWEIRDFDSHSYFTLYKCKMSSIICDELYHTSHQMFVDKILIDKEKNEVSIIDSDFELGLAFTHGGNSRSYDGYPVQLGDHVYQLSIRYDYGGCETKDCDIYAYIYTMYKCNLDYTSCDLLPVQYNMTSGYGISLDVNKLTNEISAHDLDGTLIFTYSEHPVCYVNGCVILDR